MKYGPYQSRKIYGLAFAGLFSHSPAACVKPYRVSRRTRLYCIRLISASLMCLAIATFSAIAPATAAEPSAPSSPSAPTEADAQKFVQIITNDALTILRTSPSASAREEAFGKLIDRLTNMRRIARFTLGPAARTIGDDDLHRFQTALRNTLVKIYANRLASYTDERVETRSVQQKGRNFLVASQIIFASDRPPLDMTWWVIAEKDGSLSLFDIQILGVWMAQEQRDIFTGILKSNSQSIDALISHLDDQHVQADTNYP